MQDSVKLDRDKYIGGSDIPVILGISHFKKRFDLLQEKCGLREDHFEGNMYTEYGNRMEPVIRDWINTRGGRGFVEGKHFSPIYLDGVELTDISYRLHTDGEEEDTILEVKTTSEIHDRVEEYDVYLSQLIFYMMKTNKRYGMLAVYHRPEDFSEVFDPDRLQLFTIYIEEYGQMVARVNSAVENFLRDRLIMLENPFISEEELLPADVSVMVNNMLLLEQRLNELKEIQNECEKQKESLLAAMNKQEIKSFKTESGILITAIAPTEDKTEKNTVFDDKKFSEDHPRLYKKYSEVKETTKKGRKGYLKITYPKKEEE